MAYASKAAEASAKWAAIAIGFSVPISVAADNILMPTVLLFWIIGGSFTEKYEVIKRSPVALASLSLIGMLGVGMFYGNAPFREALDAFGKYIDLLFVPIFVTIFREKETKRHALNAFVFAMLLTLLISYLLKFGIVHQNSILRGFPENPYVFKLHITQNFFMSYCALILAVWFFQERRKRIVWGILTVLALFNVLFMVQGRTGYVVLAL
ncbi:MAG TPA: hypothetical protein PLK99_09455, partial [Burkholderiales bacterium]|nr:hypothetical protein [Burkholderiales bacterium]